MNLYSVQLTINATAYIKAESAQEALEIARDEYASETTEDVGGYCSELEYDNPELPDVSLSPAMTFGDKIEAADVELAEEDIPEGDGDDEEEEEEADA